MMVCVSVLYMGGVQHTYSVNILCVFHLTSTQVTHKSPHTAVGARNTVLFLYTRSCTPVRLSSCLNPNGRSVGDREGAATNVNVSTMPSATPAAAAERWRRAAVSADSDVAAAVREVGRVENELRDRRQREVSTVPAAL